MLLFYSSSVYNYNRKYLFAFKFVRHQSSLIPYLARPIVDILNPENDSVPIWACRQNIKYSRMIFNQPIAAHPVLVAQTIHSFNVMNIPQVAVVGRSNVGKSSLLNALVNGREIARTSATPGRTRHLFTFDLSNDLSLVDLPGYGYARVPKRIRYDWSILIEEYFNRAKSLKRVISLVECTKGLNDLDFKLWEMLVEKKIKFQLVLTKVDLLKPLELHAVMLRVMSAMKEYEKELLWPYLHAVSSRNTLGIAELQCSLGCIAAENRLKTNNKFSVKNKE